MKKVTNFDERELNRLTKLISESMDKEELDEILGGTKIGDFFQGVKGLYQGEGFYYFKYLSKIKNRSKKVLTELDDIKKFVEELFELKGRIEKVKNIAPEKKLRLLNLIQEVETLWTPFGLPFTDVIKKLNKISSEKLSGERYDVVPDLKKDEIDSDLMSGKEGTGKLTSTPKVVTPTNDDTKKTSSGTITSKQGVNPLTTTGETKSTEEKEKKENLKEEIDRFKQLIK